MARISKKIDMVVVVLRQGAVGGLIGKASPTKDGLMPSGLAPVEMSDEDNNIWYEVTGSGTFIIAHHHPLLIYASIYLCIISSHRANASTPVVMQLYKGLVSSLQIKVYTSKADSESSKLYFKASNFSWVKFIPLSQGISLKKTSDDVETLPIFTPNATTQQ